MLRLRELLVAGDGVRLRVEEQADAQVQLPHRLHVRQPAPACPCARPRVVRRASRASSATSGDGGGGGGGGGGRRRPPKPDERFGALSETDPGSGARAGGLSSAPAARLAWLCIVLCSGLHGAHALHGEGLHDEGFEDDVRGAPLGGAVGAAGSEVSPLSRPRRSSALSIPVSNTCVQPFIFGITCRYQCGEDSVASSKHPEILREKKQELGDMSLCVVAEPYHRMTIPVTFLVMI